MLPADRLSGCDVSIGTEFVDIYMAMDGFVNNSTALYVLLQATPPFLRVTVVAKTDDIVLNHCNAPVTINTRGHNAFTIQVVQA